jgi:serine/threonine protein kinase
MGTSPLDRGRFVAGTVLAGRYRIIGLLGSGGMGEVYKAEDLKLHQLVALKFLPEVLSSDGPMVARFHREVRTARQITHSNVCRVHDIGQIPIGSGILHFISMEYIDGEDLATLLRRIGHLPAQKGMELARQICSGLSAAHEMGVVHRDLKPANIMLDGRGRVRITDFGLSGLADEIGRDEQSGTPAYMAPEQLNGSPATPQSDMYALGLVLYEVFTGKRPFEGRNIAELIDQHRSATPPPPSTRIREIDPLAEKAILRCLSVEPRRKTPWTARSSVSFIRRKSSGQGTGCRRNAFSGDGGGRWRADRTATRPGLGVSDSDCDRVRGNCRPAQPREGSRSNTRSAARRAGRQGKTDRKKPGVSRPRGFSPMVSVWRKLLSDMGVRIETPPSFRPIWIKVGRAESISGTSRVLQP